MGHDPWLTHVGLLGPTGEMRGDNARDGRLADPVKPRHVGPGFAAGDHALGDLAARNRSHSPEG